MMSVGLALGKMGCGRIALYLIWVAAGTRPVCGVSRSHTHTHTHAPPNHAPRSGDWFYHFVESLSLALVLFAMYLVKIRFPHSYDERSDSFGNMNGTHHWPCLASLRLGPQVLTTTVYTHDGWCRRPTAVPAEVGALLYLAVPCFVLAVIFHPGTHWRSLAHTASIST